VADWVLRLLNPPPDHGNANYEGVSTAEAEMALAARLGLVQEGRRNRHENA
jgi:hypothetical protein